MATQGPAPLAYAMPRTTLWKTIKLPYPSPPLIVFAPAEIYQYRGRTPEKWEKGPRDVLGGLVVDLVGVDGIGPEPQHRRTRSARLSLVASPEPGAEPIFDVSFGTLVGLPNIHIGLKRLAQSGSPHYPLFVLVTPPQTAPLPGEPSDPVVKVGMEITGFYNSKPSGM